MKINSISPVLVNQANQQVKVAKKEATNNMTAPAFEAKRVPAEYALAAFAPVKKFNLSSMVVNKQAAPTVGNYQPTFGGKKKPDPINQWIKTLPFADELSPAAKRNLGNVIRKNDEETEYMKKMIHLVCKDMVTPMATTSLCKHGVMSELAKADIDTYYDKVKDKNMSIADAFVPVSASQAEGQAKAAVGDVFRVDGQDKIYVKSGDDYSRQLDMDADTYLKLYPPVERYASSQGGNGDCYLLSSINAVMENPYARPALLDCFHQKGNDVVVQFPGKETQVVFENGQLPKGTDIEKYTEGPTGMKLLEHAYGKTYEADKYAEYKDVVAEEMKKMEKDLAKWEKKNPKDSLTIKKKKEINQRMANWQAGQAKIDEAMADPNHKMLFVLDDYDNFVIGKFGPMTEDVNKVDKEYNVPSDYYTGGVGGYTDFALRMLGFDAESFLTSEDEDAIDEALFAKNPSDYIIAAGTHPEVEGEMESPQEVSYSIYSSHAYKVLPFDDKDGNRMFEVTNPWNQSHRVIMDAEKLKEFFEDFSIAKVNPNA